MTMADRSRARVRTVPADLRRRIADCAAAMAVPPEWVLRACIELGLRSEDAPIDELVDAVERIRDDPKRIVRMPRVRPRRAP